MAFLDQIFGKGSKTTQLQNYTGPQQSAMNQLLSQGQGLVPQATNFLSGLFNQPQGIPSGTLSAPAMRRFQEEIIPSIAERFTGSFGEGSQRSSAFGQQLGSAGAKLAEDLSLQELLLGLQQQNAQSQQGLQGIGLLQSLLGLGLQPQFENIYQPKTGGLVGNLLGGLGLGLGNIGTSKLFGGLF